MADNLAAVPALYFAAMLEQTKLFAVVDRLVELFLNGQLPLGAPGEKLLRYGRSLPSRLSERERRNLFSSTFGRPGGDAGSPPNRQFDHLFGQFISAIAEFDRKERIEDMLIDYGGRLERNLSQHSAGKAALASLRLQQQIKEMISIVSAAEIKRAYAARDMWQVVERVAALELGGAKNTARFRALAASGATVLEWLAKYRGRLTAVKGQIIRLPADKRLIEASEAWLAAESHSSGIEPEQAQ
jgi:hypothetical protein